MKIIINKYSDYNALKVVFFFDLMLINLDDVHLYVSISLWIPISNLVDNLSINLDFSPLNKIHSLLNISHEPQSFLFKKK